MAMGADQFDAAAFRSRLAGVIKAQGRMLTAAMKCGLPVPTLETYVYGKNLPGAANLCAIAAGLGVSADWLLTGKEPRA